MESRERPEYCSVCGGKIGDSEVLAPLYVKDELSDGEYIYLCIDCSTKYYGEIYELIRVAEQRIIKDWRENDSK
jgi:hypothetical protein